MQRCGCGLRPAAWQNLALNAAKLVAHQSVQDVLAVPVGLGVGNQVFNVGCIAEKGCACSLVPCQRNGQHNWVQPWADLSCNVAWLLQVASRPVPAAKAYELCWVLHLGTRICERCHASRLDANVIVLRQRGAMAGADVLQQLVCAAGVPFGICSCDTLACLDYDLVFDRHEASQETH